MPSETRVLVVEDDPATILMLEAVLRRSGFEVVCVRDGDHALDLIRQEPWKAVLLDLFLPGKSGLDILDALRSEGAGRGSGVIVLSAAGAASVAAAEALGPFRVVQKPFDIEELIQHIRECGTEH